ncbi:hypothetical protein, conserved [Eimeria brunetti]|uniref:Uncharacterized protein n=1 Tax=Eimeria brunetti TaxID=51314 RepID=U6LKD4_9EIME|nr:hypothetical protein, conserved [Eimeria brunetti]
MAAVKGLWKLLIAELSLWAVFVSPITLSVAPRGPLISSQGSGRRIDAFINSLRDFPCYPLVTTAPPRLHSALSGTGLRRCGGTRPGRTAGGLFQRAVGWSGWESAPHAAAAAGGECTEEFQWGRWGGAYGPDLPASCMHSGHWTREEPRAALRGFSVPTYIPRGPRGPWGPWGPGSNPGSSFLPSQERRNVGGPFAPFQRPNSFARRLYNTQDGYLPPAEAQKFPRDMQAFQEAMGRLDPKFLQFAKETASPTPKNEEILQSLSMLWRQRHMEQRQEEEQQRCLDTRASSPLFNAGDEGPLTRKSGSAFRARAYKTAYEILGNSRIPIQNIAEVLLLLRDGGLVLRGEERNIVQRGAFRSAVLQKILVVVSHGVAELIRKSRSTMREAALQDLCRLPGVSRRTAAVLFDDYLIDNAQALRDRLSSPTAGAPLPGAAARPSAPSEQWPDSPGTLHPEEKKEGLLKLFPTALSRACILHADSFGAAMDAAEFDEWQQQLLLVQQSLREVPTLSPPLSLDLPETEGGPACPTKASAKLRALPVLSLGGGIFHGRNRKLTALSLQVSLLPSWTEEEGLLPPALERAVCNGGEGAGPREQRWVQQQWEHVSQAFGGLRMQLHRGVVEALQQRHLVQEVFCENSRTKTTHAAGRLPWRQESYRLISIQSVAPRAFPFATLASRCCASAFRRLQQKAQQQWGCSLTPSGFGLPAAKRRPPPTSSRPEEPGSPSPSPSSTAAAVASSREDVHLQQQANELHVSASAATPVALAEQAWWVLDEQGVLRLLQEPLSMQERVGDISST